MKGLGKVARRNRFGVCEVGYGPRELENAVKGAGGKDKLVHRRPEQALGLRLDGAHLTHLNGGHFRIAGKVCVFEAYPLYGPSLLNP